MVNPDGRRLLAGLAVGLVGIGLAVAGTRALAEDDPKPPEPLKVLRIPVSSSLFFETRPSWETPLPFAPDFSEADRQALWEFRKTYVLEAGESVKRIASPPFRGRTLDKVLFSMRNGGDWKRTRSDWENYERVGDLSNQVYRWRLGEPVWVTGVLAGGANNRGTNLADLIALISGLPPLAIDGDQILRKTSVSGDFLIREGEPLEVVLPRLGEVIRDECNLPVRLTFRDVGRRVIMVRGRYELHSLTDLPDNPVVIAPALARDLKRHDSQSGDFDAFLNRLGRQLGWLVVADDVHAIPKDVSWVFSIDQIPATDTSRVLTLVEEQTGLSFTETTRRVRLLFVERVE